MGKGHPVSWMYMGMRCGWPQPMTTISVGGERAERESGVMEDAKVRRYSWQFCGGLSISFQKEHLIGDAYTTEEMTYEYYENPARTTVVVGVQALEGVLLPVLIQHRQLGYFFEVSFGRGIVVDFDIALEVGGDRAFDRHIVERRGRVFADSINPEDQGYEGEGEKDSDVGRIGE